MLYDLTRFKLESVNWFIEWKNREEEDSHKISLTMTKKVMIASNFLNKPETDHLRMQQERRVEMFVVKW